MFLKRKSLSTILAFSSIILSECAFSVKAKQPLKDGLLRATIKEDAIENRWIVKFKEGISVMSTNEFKKLSKTHNAKVERVYTKAINGVSVEMSTEDAKKLANDPRVAYIEQDSVVKINQAPTKINQVPTKNNQVPTWNLDRVDQRENVLDNNPYNPPNNGSGVTAYVIDTGIHTSHEEFEGRAIWGENIVGDGINDDCSGHGTSVAGTIAGDVYGVGNAITVVAVKVFPCSGGTTVSAVIAGIDWVIADATDKDKTVSNMGLTAGYSQSLNDATANMVDAGVVSVVSAGNNNFDACIFSPGSEPKAITVGSTELGDNRWPLSNYGSCVDIFAPGSEITSAWYTSNTALNANSGTSMASAHVVGGVALLLSANIPDATAGLIESASVVDIGNEGVGSPELMVYVGNFAPTVSPAPTPEPSRSSSTTPTISDVPSSVPTGCEGDFFNVDVRTDLFPEDTSWILINTCSDETIFERPQGYFTSADTLYEDAFCSAESAQYEFTIFDSVGDGFCCFFGEGEYTVSMNGDEVATGGNFSDEDSTTFGSCGPTSAPTPGPPTTSPTECSGDFINIDILTDIYPEETSWILENKCDDSTIFERPQGYYTSEDTLYEDAFCSAESAQYEFTIFDSFGDGFCCFYSAGEYTVSMNGNEVATGGEFDFQDSTTFGSCGPTSAPTPGPSTTPTTSNVPSSAPSPGLSTTPTISDVPSSALTGCQGDFINIDILTDNYPGETSYTLENTCSDETIFERPHGYFTSSNTLYEDTFCSAASAQYEFTIFDSFGDGVCCHYGTGEYTVSKNGVEVATGGEFGSHESTTFGSCGPTSAPTPGPSTTPTTSNVPSFAPTPGLSTTPTTSNVPSSAATECQGDFINIDILTDQYPGETSYTLQETCDGTTIFERPHGYFTSSGELYEDTICVSRSFEYVFTIFDSYGDGLCCHYGNGEYTVTLNESEAAAGGDFGSHESTTFGNCGPTPPPSPGPPTTSPTECSGDSINIDILTDDYPQETSYTLQETCDGTTILERPQGFFNSSGELYEDTICIFSSFEYVFTILDSFGDGICCDEGDGAYTVTLNGSEVATGGEFGDEDVATFGSCVGVTCFNSPLAVAWGGNTMHCEEMPNGGCDHNMAQSHCPDTCDACGSHATVDSMAPFVYQGSTVSCALLASKPPNFINMACNIDEIAQTCRSTCGN